MDETQGWYFCRNEETCLIGPVLTDVLADISGNCLSVNIYSVTVGVEC